MPPPDFSKTLGESIRFVPYQRPAGPTSPATPQRAQKMPAKNGNGSDMPSVGAAPGQKRLNIESPSGPQESKCQQTKVSDDELTVIGDNNMTDMEDVDDNGFKVVHHRKDRTVGVSVLITATEQGRDLGQQVTVGAPSDLQLWRRKRFIAGPKSHRDVSSEKAAADSPKEEGPRFAYTKDFLRLKWLDNTSNVSVKTVKKSVTTANQKAILESRSQQAPENTTTFVEAPVASTLTEAVASDSVSPRSHNRPYASTLSPTQETKEAPHSSSLDCDQVLRALFMALPWPYDRTLPGCLKTQRKNYCKLYWPLSQ
ncbi:hypothetical protein HPB50_023207 [Hyalomma asiaticum]|uniref:Uncharacterized protein n=1 Tax=Hyalomma asiaticum TaxID=266040 RepID=A0ACB7TPZ1_HYAAI|nr:hypothetical protein HPB50_023207 [Hyalomma asiaticum]